jgi:hypothetical protein
MSNLYRLTKGAAEVARLFRAEAVPRGQLRGGGLSQLSGARRCGVGRRRARRAKMTWGFPLAVL